MIFTSLLRVDRKAEIVEIGIHHLASSVPPEDFAKYPMQHLIFGPDCMYPHGPSTLRDLLPGVKRVYLYPKIAFTELSPDLVGIRGAANIFEFGGTRDKGLRLIEMDLLGPAADEKTAPTRNF
jgi:hypothetical protein